MKTVTVLICAHNEEATVADTIRSIAHQTRAPDTILIVDDGSTDRTYDAALRAVFGRGAVIRIDGSGKKSRAQNYALPFIKTDLVMTVDADTLLQRDAIEKLVKVFETDNPPAGACGKVLPRDVRGIWRRGRLIEYRLGQVYYKALQSEYNAVLVASGCFSCYDVSIIRERGGFEDPALTRTGKIDLTEDMGITMWLITEGKKFGLGGRRVEFVKDAKAYTLDPPNFKIYRHQIRRWYSGYFQNLKLYWRPLLKFKNPVLSSYIVSSLFDGLIGSALIAYFALAAWFHYETSTFALYLMIALGIELAFFTLFSLTDAARDKKFWQTFVSLPCFIVTAAVNRVYFFEAFIREIILRKPLSHWEKGH